MHELSVCFDILRQVERLVEWQQSDRAVKSYEDNKTRIIELYDKISAAEFGDSEALAEIREQDVNAIVVYLGNFGPEGPTTLLMQKLPAGMNLRILEKQPAGCWPITCLPSGILSRKTRIQRMRSSTTSVMSST